MDMSNTWSILFYKIASLLEEKILLFCGISDFSQQDEFGVEGVVFVRFFELFMKQDWEGEGVDHLWNWAEHAAGMIGNITLEPRFWKNRHHRSLSPIRCSLSDEELEEKLSRKIDELTVNHKKMAKESHPEFLRLNLENYARIIEETQLK